MTKLIRLSPTDIEYAINSDDSRGYAWNFYTGCLHGSMGICFVSPHCWAKSITKRFKPFYPQGFEPAFYPEALLSPLYLRKPSVILTCFMGDLFGDWVDPERLWENFLGNARSLREWIFATIEACPQHTFLFLTKAPSNLLKWGKFPDNGWVGVTVCNQKMYNDAIACLAGVDAKHKWLSFEPLLEEIVIQPPYDLEGINWVVIGAQSNLVQYPQVHWVENIVYECMGEHIPAWLKKNLVQALPPAPPFYVPPLEVPAKGKFEMLYRQELPNFDTH